ncbi:hypothetical protein ACH5RR_002210 [Cinchona calisaya]|uniref:Citrate transporter-like domain-containing protein n=1 Tax=Cinchona calisaya TaxID=153742 RepID=A0ABD3B5N2_9GENT
MSTLPPIRARHLAPSHPYSNLHHHHYPLGFSPPLSLKFSQPYFGQYFYRLRYGPRFLQSNGVLARAENKSRGPSSSSSATQKQQQQPQPNLEKQQLQPKTDFLKALAILAAAGTGTLAINHSWVAENQVTHLMTLPFEESLAINKSGVGLLMVVNLRVIRSIGAPSTDIAVSELSHASAEVSDIVCVFFLLGAMTIVDIVDAHQRFKLVMDNITTRKPRTLLWVIGFVTFFLSSVLDNLTSTIVMVSLLRKLAPPSEYRKLLGAVVVIAANAGGAWTPIGDVTNTMLWIHGQVSTLQIMKRSKWERTEFSKCFDFRQMAPRGKLVFSVGVRALLSVPMFKALIGLPPYMGMLLGLCVLWILAIHYGESERLKVPQALSRIDTQRVLFSLGILLSVSSLEAPGILWELANYLDANISNVELIASAIGVVSAIIDNVPLVAATMGMYDLASFPQDSEFWQLVAYCDGTGGSMLIIGSAAAGVAFMGMEKVDFFWYLCKVSGFAFAGYAAGIAACCLAVHNLNFSLPSTLGQFSVSFPSFPVHELQELVDGAGQYIHLNVAICILLMVNANRESMEEGYVELSTRFL